MSDTEDQNSTFHNFRKIGLSKKAWTDPTLSKAMTASVYIFETQQNKM